jgi:CheY-like chemotaxis protein
MVSVPDGPLWLQADAARLCQVLTNLLNNAAKFTEPGGRIELSVETAGARPEGVPGEAPAAAEAVIRVRDTGVGVSAEVLPYVFGLFTQAESTLDRSQGGLGIGLTLVRRLTEMHGGSVAARSDGPGRGAEFEVRLPLSGTSSTSIPDRQTPREAVEPGRGLRVLVVDDNVDAAETLAEIVEGWGYEARVAYKGEAAVRLAREFRPDAVLCDIGLPGMDGYDVAQALRSAPETAGAHLIAVTGYGQHRDVSRSREAGFDAHLVKPVDSAELERRLAALIPGSATP